MTIEKANNILNIMRNTSNEQVFTMPVAQFQAIVTLIGETQYTFYKAGLFDLETECMNLESAWFQRQMMIGS